MAKENRDFDKTVLTVCCNKVDVVQNENGNGNRQVDELEARLWADLRKFSYFETSALSGMGINDMFQAFFSQVSHFGSDDMYSMQFIILLFANRPNVR